MTSVVMTHSGILSPIREGKVPDSKAPPAGFKQIVIVRQKSASGQAAAPGIHLPTDASVIKLDFNKDPSKGGKIVEIENGRDAGTVDFDKNDPEYKPKAKKKFKELKKDKLPPQKPFKIKRGPGRPRSPGRAAVVHNRGAIGFSRIPAVSHASQMASAGMADQDTPIDLSLKPTPPPPNINVIKADDKDTEHDLYKFLDYRPKSSVLSKQQERDYEDTIDSVIGNKTLESAKSLHRETSIMKEKKAKQTDEWRVSHISESYVGDDDENKNRDYSRPESEGQYPPPTTIAPHLKFLYGAPVSTVPVSPRPRGRPRGSGSGFYRSHAGRSPMGGRRGRPPLHRGSPGPGRPPLNRSPGRPPLNRSPGRPPLNRSPGRPSTGRSPGRPKGSGLSPRPRGRPRGSKSPRGRGASPRGGSPRAIAHLKFDENNDSNESKSTHIFKLDNDDSEATLFEFPSRSPAPSPKKEPSPAPIRRSPSADNRSSSIPSPAPTELAGSSDSRDVSPAVSPCSDHSLPIKKEATPEEVTRISPVPERFPEKEVAAEKKDKDLKKPWDTNKDIKLEIDREMAQKEHADRERKERERSLTRDYKDTGKDRDRERKEHSTDREMKSHSREREHRESSRDREREHKETSRDREREHKDSSRDRERGHKDSSRDRERDHKEPSRDREREHKETSRDREREHKEHSRDREHKEHSKDRDRDRSKEHRKDKKKKKKKNKDKEKEKEDDKDREKDKKEKHKEKKEREREKESREESPSIQPLQKLKIKFGGGSSSSPGSFSISTAKPVSQTAPKHEPSPKPEHVSPVHRPEIPKLKFKMMPPKSDASNESDKSWVSSIKKEDSPSSKQEPAISSPARVSPGPGSRTVSPKPKPVIDSDSEHGSDDGLVSDKPEKSGEEEVTVSVVKGKIIVKKPAKRGKRKGSGKKGRPKGESFKKEPSGLLISESSEGPVLAIKREPEKEASPISPPFSPQNVPSPITIPALKAAPPPPSPPAPSKKISPPKPKPILKEQKPMSPLVKDITKPKPVPVPVPKPAKITKSPRRLSPKKSPKISPTSKKKGNVSPVKTSPSKSFPFMEFTSPRTPSPHRSSSPSASAPSSPMYSPASSPARDSPLHFQIPPTPAFPTRTHSPPASPLSRQISTDDEIEAPSVSSVTVEKSRMPPPDLPPMPPTAAQRRAQRFVITETVGSFVNECGEKIWICPACTMQDDGSPMIGCDMCDDWYHWVCVGIKEEPSEDEPWYCPKCTKPSKSKSKRGRKKKKT